MWAIPALEAFCGKRTWTRYVTAAMQKTARSCLINPGYGIPRARDAGGAVG